jgi:hypothetical protein
MCISKVRYVGLAGLDSEYLVSLKVDPAVVQRFRHNLPVSDIAVEHRLPVLLYDA